MSVANCVRGSSVFVFAIYAALCFDPGGRPGPRLLFFDPAPVTETLQPVAVAGRIGMELVSQRFFTARLTAVVALAVVTIAKVTMAMLTTPVGDVRLALWRAERLAVTGGGLFVSGLAANSAGFPTVTAARVRTARSNATATA